MPPRASAATVDKRSVFIFILHKEGLSCGPVPKSLWPPYGICSSAPNICSSLPWRWRFGSPGRNNAISGAGAVARDGRRKEIGPAQGLGAQYLVPQGIVVETAGKSGRGSDERITAREVPY